MNLLLDTHVFLWWLADKPSLRKETKGYIQDPQNSIFVSSASLWEIVIKKSIGKLDIKSSWTQSLNHSDFESLPISSEHALNTEKLPLLHKDPFDRMLISQAQLEGLSLVTGDSQILQYKFPFLMAC